MTVDLKKLISEYKKKEITKEEFFSRLPFDLNQKSLIINEIFTDIISFKKSDEINLGLTLMYTIESDNEFTNILNNLLIEPWHNRYEDIIHDLQKRKKPESVVFIKQAIQSKYDYLELYNTGSGQFISQCGYALYSIGTKDAIQTINDLANSDNEMIRIEMQYQIKRINDDPDSENTSKTKRWWTI